MKNRLSRVSARIGWLNERIGKGGSWLTTLLVLFVCFDVVTRYLFSDSEAWIMELEWHLFSLIFLFGAGYAFKHDRHVRVDLFYNRLPAKDQAWVNIIGGLFFLLPWTAVLAYVAFGYARESFLLKETSPDPGGLPARYLIKFSVCLGMLLLFLQGVASIIDAVLVLINGDGQEAMEPDEKELKEII